jgi:photosystem II stability/assembly factor-like uncharacterized protein
MAALESARARRAVPLIGAALAAVLVAGLLYLRAAAPSAGGTVSPTPSPVPMLMGPYGATYDFLTPKQGWALVIDYLSFPETNFWLFRTGDPARQWEELYAAPTTAYRGGYIQFYDAQHGFAYVGTTLLRSVDGGSHWRKVVLPGLLTDAVFSSPTIGWAMAFDGSQQHLYQTTDAGATWIRAAADPPPYALLRSDFGNEPSGFRDSGEGWLAAAVPAAPMVFLTMDGGVSWRTIGVPLPQSARQNAGYLTSVRLVPGGGVVVFVRESLGLVLGAFFSSDRGVSWRALTFPTSTPTSDNLSFVDPAHWWLLRAGHVYKTADAGMTWTPVAMAGLPDGWSTGVGHVIDARHAWWAMTLSADSSRSALAMTSDGGAHWRMVDVPHVI